MPMPDGPVFEGACSSSHSTKLVVALRASAIASFKLYEPGNYVTTWFPSSASALILAMKKEKAAFQLYTDLAAETEDPEVKAIFEGLAQEEAKHKLRFEVEYDDMILTEN